VGACKARRLIQETVHHGKREDGEPLSSRREMLTGGKKEITEQNASRQSRRERCESGLDSVSCSQRLTIERVLDVRDGPNCVEQLRWCARDDRQPLATRGQTLLNLRENSRDVVRNERVLCTCTRSVSDNDKTTCHGHTEGSRTSAARCNHHRVVAKFSSIGGMSPTELAS
jgi:hypothetical protein